MKLFIIVTLFILGLLLSVPVSPVSAHTGGPPYVKINGIYSQTNPILNTYAPVTFSVGSDVASSSGYVVAQPVTFEVDERYFPNPYVQAQSPFGVPVANQAPAVSPVFRWDFQDGSATQEGNHVTHAFTKPGTFVIRLEAKFPGKTENFASVNTIQLTVFPTGDFSPPQAVISINGQTVNDPLSDTVSVKPMIPISFDASRSTGNIIKYQWDFGDEKGTGGKTVRHRYGRDVYFPTVVLRVTDENGIVSDTYALADLPFQKPNVILAFYYKVADFVTSLFQRE